MQACRPAMVELGLAEGEEDPMFRGMELNREQKHLEKGARKQLERAKKGRLCNNQTEWEAVVEDAHGNAKPLFVTGPQGTGKSTVVDKCVRKCLRDGGRVLYALPTAQQASRVRSGADVDMCSGAFFLYKEAVEVMDCLTPYDMVAVGFSNCHKMTLKESSRCGKLPTKFLHWCWRETLATAWSGSVQGNRQPSVEHGLPSQSTSNVAVQGRDLEGQVACVAHCAAQQAPAERHMPWTQSMDRPQ